MAERTNVIVSGLWWSGSSALVDWLKEFKFVSVIPGEFNAFRKPELIGDLIAANSKSEKAALSKNMLVNHFTYKSFIKAGFVDLINFGGGKRKPKIEKTFRFLYATRRFLHNYQAKMNDILASENELDYWKNWLQHVTAECNNRLVVFDQAIYHGMHLAKWPSLFSPFKLIIVCRNPYDQLAEIKRKRKLFKKRSDPILRQFGVGVEGFARSLMYQYTSVLPEVVARCKKNVRVIEFEHFVLNHEDASRSLSSFLGLVDTGAKIGRFFDPEVSKSNIGIGSDLERCRLLRELEGSYARFIDTYSNLSY